MDFIRILIGEILAREALYTRIIHLEPTRATEATEADLEWIELLRAMDMDRMHTSNALNR
jgi:hypothetical protein